MDFKTQRCIITKLNSEDYTDIKSLYSDPITREYLGGVVIKDFDQKFENLLRGSDLNWVAREKKTQSFIGMLSLGYHHEKIHKELSYQLLSSQFKKGYAFETVSQIINYIFKSLDIEEIWAETQKENKASVQLLEKLDFCFYKNVERFENMQSIYILRRKN